MTGAISQPGGAGETHHCFDGQFQGAVRNRFFSINPVTAGPGTRLIVPHVSHMPNVLHMPPVAHVPRVPHVPRVAHLPRVRRVPHVPHVNTHT